MKKIIFLLLVLILFSGCKNTTTKTNASFSENVTNSKHLSVDKTNTNFYPTRDEFNRARSIYFEQMSPEDLQAFCSWISTQNLSMEHTYVFENKFEQYQNPDSPIWNLYEETGDEVIIGYAFDDEEKERNHPEMNDEEYASLYGSPVVTQNNYDAKAYIDKLTSFQSTIYNEDFSKLIDQLIDYYNLAQQTHDVQYLLKIYYIYHDMDYYLIRYAPDAFSDENIIDKSTIYTYYNSLPVYQ